MHLLRRDAMLDFMPPFCPILLCAIKLFKMALVSVKRAMENQKRRSRPKFACISEGARCDREPSKLLLKKIMNLFNRNKAIKRYVGSHIMNSVPNSSALKTFSLFN